MRPHHVRAFTVVFAVLLLTGAVFFVQEQSLTGNAVATFGAAVLVTDGSEASPVTPPSQPRGSPSRSTPRIGPWEFTPSAHITLENPSSPEVLPSPTEPSESDPSEGAKEERFALSSTQIAVPDFALGDTITVPFTIENLENASMNLTFTSDDPSVHVPEPITILPGETATVQIGITVDWEGERTVAVTVSDGVSVQQAVLTVRGPNREEVVATAIPLEPVTESPFNMDVPSWATEAALLVGLLGVGSLMAFHYRKPSMPAIKTQEPDIFAASSVSNVATVEPVAPAVETIVEVPVQPPVEVVAPVTPEPIVSPPSVPAEPTAPVQEPPKTA